MPASTRLSEDRVDSILLEKMLAGASVRDAAAAAGCDESTARRHFRQKPELREALEQARRAMLDKAVELAAESAVDAVKTLEDLSKSAESEMVRLNAARAIVSLVPDLVRLVDLDERLAKLEALLSGRRAA
jgi:hypothetical protein